MLAASSAWTMAAMLSACVPTHLPARLSARPPTATSGPSSVLRLQRDLDSFLAAPVLEHSVWGVLVTSLATDEALYSVNADKLLMPASNMKIVTLAAAADRLGWDYQYETRLLASAPIDRDSGVLHGDLIVVGSGDPSIGDRDRLPPGVFDEWAGKLTRLGLRRVEGRVLGDDRAFDSQTLGSGWTWDDLGEGYAAGVSALQFNENVVVATIGPGPAVGDDAIVTVAPSGSGLVIRNELKTTPDGSARAVAARRLPGSDQLLLRGAVPVSSGPSSHTVSVDNPTRFFVTALRTTIIEHGIDVRGPAADAKEVSDAPAPSAAVTLLSYRSPPLSTLALRLMKVSQNLYAETLLKTIGAASGTPTSDAGRASARSVVLGWGVGAGGLIMRDGSGLSRYNYVTPAALVRILTHIDRDDTPRGPFESALPIAGEDGTLAQRMPDTLASGNARAKTGSIANARALSGYVRTADDEPLVFSIIANNFETAPSVIEQTIDAIVERLAEFSR